MVLEARQVFQRYYFHALRNRAAEYQSNPDLKARQAIRERCMIEARSQVRQQVLAKIALDTSLDEIGKEERWAEVMADLTKLEISLAQTPVDIEDLKKGAAQISKKLGK